MGNIPAYSKMHFFYYMFLEKFLRLLPIPQWRVFFLRMLGAEISKTAVVHEVIFQNPYTPKGFRNLVMGDKASIQPGCIIDLSAKVVIEEMVTISQGVIIMTHSNPGLKLKKPLAKIYPPVYQEVRIGRGAWIGAGAIIFHGVRIGELSVVGAGSLVMQDVPPRSVVAGIPAKKVKDISIPANEVQ